MGMYDIRVLCLLIVVSAVAWAICMVWRLRRGRRPGSRWPGDP